jgi:serine/threonine protein kinase
MMASLEGTVIKDEIEEMIEKKIVLYPFSIFINNKGKTYYSLKLDDKNSWLKAIREKIGAYNLYDYYETRDVIGKGKFGVVRKAIHKKTQKPVAIKIMKKASIKQEDLELIRREIDILKICQHPNIIRLLDIFENSSYIFLVLELLGGGDLFTYLENRKFSIPEQSAAAIIHSLILALQYLHSYGIAHRDLKPENILMIKEDTDSDIKIADFGLSKIIAPDERTNEPFGTLSYVAPEVLRQEPYDKRVDLWSLGVICYLLLCSTLPFDSENDQEIGKMVLERDPDYQIGKWKDASPESREFTQSKIVSRIAEQGQE